MHSVSWDCSHQKPKSPFYDYYFRQNEQHAIKSFTTVSILYTCILRIYCQFTTVQIPKQHRVMFMNWVQIENLAECFNYGFEFLGPYRKLAANSPKSTVWDDLKIVFTKHTYYCHEAVAVLFMNFRELLFLYALEIREWETYCFVGNGYSFENLSHKTSVLSVLLWCDGSFIESWLSIYQHLVEQEHYRTSFIFHHSMQLTKNSVHQKNVNSTREKKSWFVFQWPWQKKGEGLIKGISCVHSISVV